VVPIWFQFRPRGTSHARAIVRGIGKRSYGSGQLFVRADGNGRETYYGAWRVGGRRVKRRLGPKRRAGTSDGLTRTQAEAELRRRIATEVVVAGAQRRTVAEAGGACEWPASTIRDRALRSYLRFYNRRRPHSAAAGRPPITRVQHLRGQDS
jgi:hypothetical protein